MINACRITGLVVVVVSLVLGTGGVALAKAPPDPHTLGATTLSNIELNGKPGTKFVAYAGEELKVSASWSDANTGCPSCLDYVAAGFAGQSDAGCIEDLGVDGENGTGQVDLGPAPAKLGKYRIVAQFEEVYNCGEEWSANNSTSYPVLIEIKVKAPPTPPDPHTIGATTLSNIKLNRKPHTKLTVSPGEEVKVSANWSDANTGCPACIDYVSVGFAGQSAAGCLEEFGGDGESGTGEVDAGPAPMTPGTYTIVSQFEEQRSCGPTWSASNSYSYPVLAVVKVKEKAKA